MSTSSTSIEITPKHSIVNYTWAFFKPKVTIGGNTTKYEWGKPAAISVAPRQQQVQVHFSTLFVRRAGKASITIDVQPGAVTRLTYKAPFLFSFFSGKITPA